MPVLFLVLLRAYARGLCTLNFLHLQTQFTNFSKATVLALPFAPPIKTSPSEAQILVVEISSSCEVSVGGIWGLKLPLNFGITSGRGQAFPPDHRGMSMLLWGEAKREILTIIK